MMPSDLREWQKQMNLTYDSAAAALGVSRATYANYINEHTRIPPAVGLACAALAAGLSAYSSAH